jgi:hypothetical protein
MRIVQKVQYIIYWLPETEHLSLRESENIDELATPGWFVNGSLINKGVIRSAYKIPIDKETQRSILCIYTKP